MQLVIASGKGGVGKSMLASSLAVLLAKEMKIVACDCDVDAPNLAIWLGINKADKTISIASSEKARIIEGLCTNCGACAKACKFGAIEKVNNKYRVNQFLCEGCGACKLVCKANAIEISEVKNCRVMINESSLAFPVIWAQLEPGESGSGRVVEKIKEIASSYESDLLICDAPAGIGCPVIASFRDCDFALLVTEPTPTGESDLERVLKLVEHFRIDHAIVLNKVGLNEEMEKRMRSKFGEKIIGEIRYDEAVVESLVQMKPVVSFDCKASRDVKAIFSSLKSLLKGRGFL